MAYIEPVNEYLTEAWSKAFEPLGIEVFTTKPENQKLKFIFQDYDTYDFDRRDQEADVVYSYIFRKGITRKNYLGSTILHYRVKRENSILHSAWPDSFYFELDFPEFLDDALDECWELKQEIEQNDKTWILKPALGERAHGIRIFRTQDELQQIFDEQLTGDEDDEGMQMRQYVVQEYISNPLLVDDRKFHLRVYVLCVGSLQVFVDTDILALFSNEKYNPDDLDDMRGHLTNTCYQGSDARVELLHKLLPEQFETITSEICDVVNNLFQAAQGNPINFQALPNAFEFYGLDFLVTNDYHVKLLEVNAYPDFKQTGAELRHVVDDLLNETVGYIFGGKEPKKLRKVL